MSYDTVARPYAASYVLLRRSDGKVAFVLRTTTGWMDGYYGLPAGKVEAGESYLQAAVREAKEEAGVDITPNDLTPVLSFHRKANDDTLEWVDVFFETKVWKGEPYNAEPSKHGKLEWFSLDELPENVVPVLGVMLEHITAGNVFGEFGWEV